MNDGGFGELTYALPEPHLIVSSGGEIVAANPAAAALFGMSPLELRGRPLAAVAKTPPDDVATLLRSAARVRTCVPGALTIRRPTGHPVRLRCDGALLRPRDAITPALILLRLVERHAAGSRFLLLTQRVDELTREIRRRRELEQERAVLLKEERSMRRALEAQAAEVEAAQMETETVIEELREANLALKAAAADAERARDAADHANEAKSAFLATMSHELRTPLNAIGGYTDLLLARVRGPLTDEQQGDLERLRRASHHLSGLINNVLNFAKLEAGQGEFADEALFAADILSAATAMIEPQASARGTVFETVPPPLLTLRGDRDKVLRILLNLLSNAVRFTFVGGRVTLSAAPGPESHDSTVQVEVRDTGRGIPPEQLSRVFEPFVQVGRRLSGEDGGVGLGLAISRELARAMGGDVTAESTVGSGSLFRLTLPRQSGE